MAILGYTVRQIFETVTKPKKVTASPVLFPRICLLSFLEIHKLLVIRKEESPKEHGMEVLEVVDLVNNPGAGRVEAGGLGTLDSWLPCCCAHLE